MKDFFLVNSDCKIKYNFEIIRHMKRFVFVSYNISIVLFSQTHTIYRTGFSCSWGTARKTRPC